MLSILARFLLSTSGIKTIVGFGFGAVIIWGGVHFISSEKEAAVNEYKAQLTEVNKGFAKKLNQAIEKHPKDKYGETPDYMGRFTFNPEPVPLPENKDDLVFPQPVESIDDVVETLPIYYEGQEDLDIKETSNE